MSGIRIIGGQHRGRRLPSPPDRSIRPTSDRAREALFNILEHGDLIGGARFLDLFCGTGAVGLEACSRGALDIWLIDREVTQVRKAVDALDRPGNVHIRQADATSPGRAPCPFDIVFLDPPYRSDLAPPALDALAEDWFADDALIVVELAAREGLTPPPAYRVERERRYGAARFVFLRRQDGFSLAETS